MEQQDYSLKIITAQQTYVVRHPVLRIGRPIADCAFEGDFDKSTLHLGLYFKTDLIGVATFLKNSNKHFLEHDQYQLRGMATLKEFQSKGLGNFILTEGEKILKSKCQRIWLNARNVALNFYIKNEYAIVGEPFEIPNIGLHYLMSKKLI